jgi:hypothetical protein
MSKLTTIRSNEKINCSITDTRDTLFTKGNEGQQLQLQGIIAGYWRVLILKVRRLLLM